MIDFDDLDCSDTTIILRVANLDPAGCPRGECSCCDCLEWLEVNDARSTRPLWPHGYNVIRRWDGMSANIAAGDMRCPAEYQFCARCGCHAVWHEDISEQMSQLLGSGVLVEAHPGWDDVERALFCQTAGAFRPEPSSEDPADNNEHGGLPAELDRLQEEHLVDSWWDCLFNTWRGAVQLQAKRQVWHPEGKQLSWDLLEGPCPQLRLEFPEGALLLDLHARGRRATLPNAAGTVFRRARARGTWLPTTGAAGAEGSTPSQGGGAEASRPSNRRPSAESPEGLAGPQPAQPQRQPLVSVISPTSAGRQAFHPFLYHCFCQQKYPAKQLVVVDTGPVPSPFFAAGPPTGDPRVIYRWFFTEGAPWTIGAKRNLACYLASGAVIVHFDDDDIYAPWYLDAVVNAMLQGAALDAQGLDVRLAVADEDVTTAGDGLPGGKGGLCAEANPNPPLRFEGFAAEAVTLSSWYTFELATESFRVCDVDCHHEGKKDWALGYGFSYAYLRDAWRTHRFRDVNLGEDFDFMEGIFARGARVALLRDQVGLCAHTHHNQNFSPWEKDAEAPSPRGHVGEVLVDLGKKLRQVIMPGLAKVPRAYRTKEVHAPLNRRSAAALQNDLIAEYTKEDFQRRLRAAFAATRGDPMKRKLEQRRICLEVQGPVIERYGFENSWEGVLRSTVAFTSDINADPYISRKNEFIHWLVDPEKQERQPLPDDRMRQLITDLCKTAKIRKRRADM